MLYCLVTSLEMIPVGDYAQPQAARRVPAARCAHALLARVHVPERYKCGLLPDLHALQTPFLVHAIGNGDMKQQQQGGRRQPFKARGTQQVAKPAGKVPSLKNQIRSAERLLAKVRETGRMPCPCLAPHRR